MPELTLAVPLAALTVREAAFGALALTAVATALLVVLHRTPVIQGLFLVLHLLSIAGLFAALDARFLAVMQVLIYAGAVVVLIVFVIMLLNLQPEARGGPGYVMLLLSL
ncbi:MAG: NADH-quinone oxidoreductase subunit J, partial [Acidobacteriota bacterium]|nr:NADH-quinone oxidoreductase subunit J [Acidobacteriota bacterium]